MEIRFHPPWNAVLTLKRKIQFNVTRFYALFTGRLRAFYGRTVSSLTKSYKANFTGEILRITQ